MEKMKWDIEACGEDSEHGSYGGKEKCESGGKVMEDDASNI